MTLINLIKMGMNNIYMGGVLVDKIISIEYCTSWGYIDRAVALAKALLNIHKNEIKELTLIPSVGGVFEVNFNGDLIFSKKQLNRYPEEEEIEKLISEKI